MTTSSFSGTYASESWTWDSARGCGNTAPFVGREPASGSGYPVFVYLGGTSEPYNGPVATRFIETMAARGFVAASVRYEDWQFYAEGIEGNAACVFGAAPASAASRLCGRATAACDQGVVVSGFSQGASIAARAANHRVGVRAAYLLGINEDPLAESGKRWQMALAQPAGTRALPNDRVRIIDGATDAPVKRRGDLNAQTGRLCWPTVTRCLGADGSGWYVVQDTEVASGFSEHCYFHGSTYCMLAPAFDPTWRSSTTAPWALQPGLAWLQSFTGSAPRRGTARR